MALGASALGTARPAGAQLRPLEPLEWGVFAPERAVLVSVGVGLHDGQDARLIGTTGRLQEVGNYMLVWRTGRVALEASGTAYRRFRENGIVSPVVAEGTEPPGGPGSVRDDDGDLRLLTAVRLSPEPSPLAVALRFGVRLPTTDNKIGLDRDATDFVATLAADYARGRLQLGGEAGIGLMTTRFPEYEQADLIQYAARVAWNGGLVTPTFRWIGQATTAPFEVQGNESLGEVRLGATIGRQRWLRVEVLRGTEAPSPHLGGLLTVGATY